MEQLLRQFNFKELICQHPTQHSINLLGTIKEQQKQQEHAILIINKTHFDNPESNLLDQIKLLQTIGKNDVYHWSLAKLINNNNNQSTPDLKLTLIYPATQLHIQKYSKQPTKIIRETPELYHQVVLPYIEKIPPTRLSWLYNILGHVTEADKIVYEDPSETQGFMIIPDLKWDQTTLASLYLLCIVRDRTIRSLRDIRPDHLQLLKAIRLKASQSIEEKYKVPKRELRMFVHYQPSYYHFHVHITHVDHLGFRGITVGQAHLLDDIIDHLEYELQSSSSRSAEDESQKKTFYQSKTFVYGLGSNHDLFDDLWAGQDVEE